MFYFFKRGENLSLSFTHSHRMLKMCSRFAVLCPDGPAVFVQPDIAFPHCNHGLYRNTHACFQHDTVAALPIVRHLRVFMHLMTDAVSCQFTDDTIALCFAVVLHRTADISKMSSRDSIFNTFIERLLCRAKQVFDFLANLSHAESVARIATESVKERTAVDGYDVTILEDGLSIGYTVHDDVVYRSTDAGRKRPSVWIRESLEGRNGSVVTDEFVCDLIQTKGRYTRLDMLC